MIGLGVGIDYSLFIVTRFRQALHDGASPEDAAALAGATAGRAVVFAGTTVAISICGLAVIGLDFVTKLGLRRRHRRAHHGLHRHHPAAGVLRLLGHKIDRWKVPGIKARRRVGRRPRAHRHRALGPVRDQPRQGHDRRGSAAPAADDRPGVHCSPGQLGRRIGPQGAAPRDRHTTCWPRASAPGSTARWSWSSTPRATQLSIPSWRQAFKATPGVASVTPPLTNPQGDLSRILIFPSTSPQSQATSDLVHHLRDTVVPNALGDTGPAPTSAARRRRSTTSPITSSRSSRCSCWWCSASRSWC